MPAGLTADPQAIDARQRSLLNPFAGILFLLVAVATYGSLRNPIYNWDMLPYMATALSYTQRDRGIVHRETYTALEEVAPPKRVEFLVGPDPYPYRAEVHADSELFWQQVPFYSVKPLYPLLVAMVHWLGVNLATATVVVSALCYAAVCLTIFGWILRYHSPFFTLLLSSALVFSPPFFQLPRLSTPDSLNLLLFVCALFSLLERQMPRLMMTLLFASIPVRPNMILIYGLLGFYLTFLAPARIRISKIECLFFAVAAAVLFGTLRLLSENYPWTTFFYHSWVAYLPSPATFSSPLGPADYLRVYLAQAKLLFEPNFLGLFGLIAVLGLVGRRRLATDFRSDAESHLLILFFAFFAIHWILYPGQIDRIYMSQYMVIAVIAAKTIGTLARDRLSWGSRPLPKTDFPEGQAW